MPRLAAGEAMGEISGRRGFMDDHEVRGWQAVRIR